MFLKAYSFLDTKTGIHSTPFFLPHEALAFRAAYDLGADNATNIGKHPSDFVLLHVGEFDDTLGALSACTPRNLGIVSAIVAAAKEHTK